MVGGGQHFLKKPVEEVLKDKEGSTFVDLEWGGKETPTSVAAEH